MELLITQQKSKVHSISNGSIQLFFTEGLCFLLQKECLPTPMSLPASYSSKILGLISTCLLLFPDLYGLAS